MRPRSRRSLLVLGATLPALGLLGGSLAAVAGCAPEKAPPRPPNLVVVVLDTVRAEHLGLYGYPRATSPALDRFADEAIVFENAQSSAPWTAPALISLVTSLYPAVHGVQAFPNAERLALGATTLAEVLSANGYDTAAFTEGGYAKGDFGLDRGMDLFPANPGDAQSHSSNLHAASRLEPNLDRALAWLRQRGERPFHLLFHTYEAHVPYRAPDVDVRAFAADFDEGAEHAALRDAIDHWNGGGSFTRDDSLLLAVHEWHCGLAELPALERKAQLAQLRRSFAPRDATERESYNQRLRDLYDAELRYTDRCLASLWAALEESGQLANTIVVVVSDHGEGFGEHGQYGHGRVLYEELLRIALIVRAPGLGPRRSTPLVRSIDVLPTLLDLMGLAAPKSPLQGRNLAPWLRGDADPPGAPAFSHALSITGEEERLETVRLGRWRLVRVAGTRQLALHDVLADPGETVDVASEHPDVARQLYELLELQAERNKALRAEIGEPLELPPPGAEALRELEALGYVEGR